MLPVNRRASDARSAFSPRSTKARKDLRALNLDGRQRVRVRAMAAVAGFPVAELVRARALGRPVVACTDATTIRELKRLGGPLKKVHLDSNGAYSAETAAALADLRVAIARLAAGDGGAP